MKRRLPVLLLLTALMAISVSQAWLTSHALSRGGSERLLYLPNGQFLKVASLGFPTMLADLIYLWSIQHYGSYKEGDRFRYLEHVYGNVIAGLDRRFVDPYLVGCLIMVVEQGDVEAGLRLLDQGMEANPEEWILPYEAGFWAYDTAGDYQRAARYFKLAMEIPGAPPSTRRLHAGMYDKRGDKETSLALWEEVLMTSKDEKVTAIATNHVHDLAIEVDVIHLERAIATYREHHARYPARLATLVEAGLLKVIPPDPDGNSYGYDPLSGEVEVVTPFRLRR